VTLKPLLTVVLKFLSGLKNPKLPDFKSRKR